MVNATDLAASGFAAVLDATDASVLDSPLDRVLDATLEPEPEPEPDTLESVASTTKKSKSSVPAVYVDELQPTLQRYLMARREREKYESLENIAAEEIRRHGMAQRQLICERTRKVASKVRLNGLVEVQAVNKYAAIAGNLEPRCREIMGDDFDDWLEAHVDVKVTPEGVAMCREMIKAVGKANFLKWFEVSQTFTVRPSLHTDISTKAAVHKRLQPLVNEGIVKMNSPSVQVVK